MLFTETPLAGSFLIAPERHGDNRGFFARTFCEMEFAERGLVVDWKQANAAYSAAVGVTRGMHYQRDPYGETKLVRCTRGRVYDVIVDMRPGSATLHQWYGAELSHSNGVQLYVPAGFAHGYQVIEADSEVAYMVSAFYTPEAECGVRWDDPAVGIDWPIRAEVAVSDKDRQWPLLQGR